MQKKYLTTLAMAAIAFSPLFVMRAASLTDLSQNYRPNASVNADTDISSSDSENDSTDSNQSDSRVRTSLSGSFSVSRDDLDKEENQSIADDFRTYVNNAVQRGVVSSSTSTSTSVSNGMIQARANANERAFEVANENSILLRAQNVSSEDDLKAFSLSAIQDDKDVNDISYNDNDIEVDYRGQGRFIGLLPVFHNVKVVVNQDGQIQFDYPWYGFLISKNSDLEAAIRAQIEAVLADKLDGGWTNTDRAELVAAIIDALRAYYGSNTATSTATSTQ